MKIFCVILAGICVFVALTLLWPGDYAPAIRAPWWAGLVLLGFAVVFIVLALIFWREE